MQVTGGFDATQVAPDQGGSKHPLGNFPFQITGTSIVGAKDQKSGMLVVEFTTPAGTIEKRYNLWHDNPQVVDIANKQLSALCHVTGIFRLDWTNEGAALRGGQGTLEVADQMVKDPQGGGAKVPNGYVEVKKVFDKNGVEPGKAAPAQQQQNPQGGAGWGNNQPNQNPNPPATQNGNSWGNPQSQQQPNNPPAQQNTGWQQNPQGGADAGAKPPWAK